MTSALIPSESAEQKAVISWWRDACYAFRLPEVILMACPAQAARSPRGGARMKAEGYRAGTPDLFLSTARRGAHGLFIEMKRQDGGTLSDSQREMSVALQSQAYSCGVAYGADAAKRLIREYLAP